LGAQGQNDHIGTAEVPLDKVFAGERFNQRVPVFDRNGKQAGELELDLTCIDVDSVELKFDSQGQFTNTFQTQRDTIFRICLHFAEQGFDSFDTALDIVL
jgi:hypothetical protein